MEGGFEARGWRWDNTKNDRWFRKRNSRWRLRSPSSHQIERVGYSPRMIEVVRWGVDSFRSSLDCVPPDKDGVCEIVTPSQKVSIAGTKGNRRFRNQTQSRSANASLISMILDFQGVCDVDLLKDMEHNSFLISGLQDKLKYSTISHRQSHHLEFHLPETRQPRHLLPLHRISFSLCNWCEQERPTNLSAGTCALVWVPSCRSGTSHKLGVRHGERIIAIRGRIYFLIKIKVFLYPTHP